LKNIKKQKMLYNIYKKLFFIQTPDEPKPLSPRTEESVSTKILSLQTEALSTLKTNGVQYFSKIN
jgi:hypothetical protein